MREGFGSNDTDRLPAGAQHTRLTRMVKRATLAELAWPDVHHVAAPTLLVPVGSLEQHGPHLPLDTDTRIARAIAQQASAAAASESLLLAPEIAYGASGEHEGFAGTVSLGHEALNSLLLEYGRSACRWAGRVLFVNGHGGNVATLRAAVTRLRYEARDVAWYPCVFPGADAHAGHTETSILLHLSPDLVRGNALEQGNDSPITELIGALREGGVAAVSANGVLGDPRGSTAAHGAKLVTDAVRELVRALRDWTVDDGGRLR